MKKILCIAYLTVALTVNAGSANAQSGQDAVIRILTGIGSEAAKELIRIMLAPRPNAPRPDVKRAAFTDKEWLVAIGQNGDDFSYYGVNLRTRNSLTLKGARVSGNSQSQVYTWNNGDYRYQVAWQPSAPQVIRLQVFDERGRELLNRLLYKTN
ncbi:MAG: hypothetical protein MUE44_07825 [Oscillatoriaceae cyanobacterium Prado104]|jgi:hypothetical protein|nr:hypothetical protein [Oscillatoriaceae cyanobacterium Prado104]